MSVLVCAPDDSEGDEMTGLFALIGGTSYTDEEINTLVRFGVYVRETWEHIERTCDLIANGDAGLRSDLALVAKFLWP